MASSAVTPLSFVAKSEVNTWPFFGTLARLQRSVFVTRQRRSQAAEARDGLIDQVAHIVVVAHVGTPILSLSADPAEFSD